MFRCGLRWSCACISLSFRMSSSSARRTGPTASVAEWYLWRLTCPTPAHVRDIVPSIARRFDVESPQRREGCTGRPTAAVSTPLAAYQYAICEYSWYSLHCDQAWARGGAHGVGKSTVVLLGVRLCRALVLVEVSILRWSKPHLLLHVRCIIDGIRQEKKHQSDGNSSM